MGFPLQKAPSPFEPIAISFVIGEYIKPNMVSRFFRRLTSTVNGSLPAAKFDVPSTGSISHTGASSSNRVMIDGSFSIVSSPIATVPGNDICNSRINFFSASMSAVVTKLPALPGLFSIISVLPREPNRVRISSSATFFTIVATFSGSIICDTYPPNKKGRTQCGPYRTRSWQDFTSCRPYHPCQALVGLPEQQALAFQLSLLP